jgi:glycerol-3-phosphate dehydrogenase (NAD(P)+)
MRFAVLGTGGWGTAIAQALAVRGCDVKLWGRDAARVAEIGRTRVNTLALPGARLDERIRWTADPAEAAAGADVVFAVIPAQFLRSALSRFKALVPEGALVLSGTKGLEIGTLLRPTEVLTQVLGPRALGVLSGPSHAEEVVTGKPASLVLACEDLTRARSVRDAMGSASLRLYVSPDVLGVELAGALKNVLAIAAGLCDGLDLGDNAKAALVTRALAEMSRYGVARGASPETFAGLAGIGDLMTTCYSRHGRNRSVGERAARGESLDAILASMTQVAEGVWTAKALHDAFAASAGRAGFSEELPICAEVHAILFERKNPRRSVVDLMTRPPRD